MNLGLRTDLLDPAIQLFWILNNDTEVTPGTFAALKNVFRRDASLGVLGSCLCYQNHPEMIQGVGGHYRPWLGTTRHFLGGQLYQEVLSDSDRPPIDYAVGAAVCIRRDVLIEAGLFPEDYFLYFEDMDWAFSVRKKTRNGASIIALRAWSCIRKGPAPAPMNRKGRRQPYWLTTTTNGTDFALRGAGIRAVTPSST